MDAVVTLKISPAELDLVRDALRTQIEASEQNGKDATLAPATRQSEKQRQLLTGDILKKLT